MYYKRKKYRLIISLLLPLLLSFSSILVYEEISSEEPDIKVDKNILGVQIPFIKSENLMEFERSLAELKNLGIDTLIVRVFQNEGDRNHRLVKKNRGTGIYFKSSVAPVVEDILQDLVRVAHKNNMKIYAWMSTRSCDWLISENKGLSDYYYDFNKRKILPSHKLNLFKNEAKDYLKKLYADLARYDIDGILFQDDLIMRHNESFSPEAKAEFLKKFGYNLLPDKMYKEIHRDYRGKIDRYSYRDEFWTWTDWKSHYIVNFLQDLIISTRKINPKLNFIINLYYETISDPENAKAWLSQDLEKIKGLDLDYYSFMFYHRQIRKELKLSYNEVKEFLKNLTKRAINRIGDPGKIIFKIQVVDWDNTSKISSKEISDIISVLKSSGALNLIFFPEIKREELDSLKMIL